MFPDSVAVKTVPAVPTTWNEEFNVVAPSTSKELLRFVAPSTFKESVREVTPTTDKFSPTFKFLAIPTPPLITIDPLVGLSD